MNAIIAYLSSKIDIVLHIEALTGCKTLGKVYIFGKTIHGLQQSVQQLSQDLAQSIIWVGLKRLVSDYSAFARNLGTRKVVIVIV